MGATEVAALLKEYRGSYIMTLAGYNAGLNSGAKCNGVYANRICTSLPSSLSVAWKGIFEAQAFSGREIGGDNDVLDFFVGHLVDVDLTRQPAA